MPLLLTKFVNILLFQRSAAYDAGYRVGYFLGIAWPYFVAAVFIVLVYILFKRRRAK